MGISRESAIHMWRVQYRSTVRNLILPKLVGAIRQPLTVTQSKEIKMAVIVQKMIQGRVSGVCFTRLQNYTNSLIIEACHGLGESLVSGKVDPDCYIIDRNSLSVIKESIGYQKVMLKMPKDNRGPIYEDIPFYKRKSKKLTHDECRGITKKCLLIEEHLDFCAADVEWTFENDVFYILQARPYTGFIT